jgi:hypothetical protein
MAEFNKEYVAHFLHMKPEDLDVSLLKQAKDAVRRKTNDLWDAFASVGQMVDNVQGTNSRIAIVYAWYADQF